MSLSRTLLLAALLAAVVPTGCRQPADDLDAFLVDYNVLYRASGPGRGRALGQRTSTSTTPPTARRIAAEEVFAACTGGRETYREARPTSTATT